MGVILDRSPSTVAAGDVPRHRDPPLVLQVLEHEADPSGPPRGRSVLANFRYVDGCAPEGSQARRARMLSSAATNSATDPP